MKDLLAILGSLFLLGCQSYTLDIDTHPQGAEVRMFNAGKGIYEVVGNTPFKIEGDDKILTLVKGSDTLAISIEKQGFVVERILVDKVIAPKGALHINLKPIEKWQDKTVKHNSHEADLVVRETQRLMQLVDSRDYQAAYNLALNLLQRYPDASVFWDMKGSIELLRGRRQTARESFQKSLALYPDNTETKEALQKLQGGGNL